MSTVLPEKFCFIAPSYAAESRSKLAKMIVDLLPDNFGKIFFTNGGADANENAVKIAKNPQASYTEKAKGAVHFQKCTAPVHYV